MSDKHDGEGPELKLIHRDDLDMQDVQQIEAYFAEHYPGMKVMFAGDAATLPDEVLADLEKLSQMYANSLVEGTCVDCGKKIPGDWPPPEEGEYNCPPGWFFLCESEFDDETGESVSVPVALSCKECDDKLNEGEVRPINLDRE